MSADPRDPYWRTIEMFQKLQPAWARDENATLSAVVKHLEPLRLPDVTLRLELAQLATAAPRHEVGSHLHPQAEIFRVESGRVTFHVAGKEVVYRRGDIGFMPPRTIHRWRNSAGNALFLGTMFSAHPASKDRNALGHRLPLAAEALGYRIDSKGEIARALDALRGEIKSSGVDTIQACCAHLTTAFILAFRQLREALGTAPSSNPAILPLNERCVLAAQACIRAQLAEPLRVQTVADAVGVSARHLNRLFAAAGLHSVGHSIEQARIEHAQWLLRQGEYPVKTIARLCGFSDAPYFCRAFKRATGRSPREFRAVHDRMS